MEPVFGHSDEEKDAAQKIPKRVEHLTCFLRLEKSAPGPQTRNDTRTCRHQDPSLDEVSFVCVSLFCTAFSRVRAARDQEASPSASATYNCLQSDEVPCLRGRGGLFVVVCVSRRAARPQSARAPRGACGGARTPALHFLGKCRLAGTDGHQASQYVAKPTEHCQEGGLPLAL